MDGKVKATKTEKILLGVSAVFLCLLLALQWYGRATGAAGHYTVETQRQAGSSELLPDMTPVDVNTAGVEALSELPGIGPTLAQRIVDYREANGPFQAVEELVNVSGIGEGKLAEILPRVTIGT